MGRCFGWWLVVPLQSTWPQPGRISQLVESEEKVVEVEEEGVEAVEEVAEEGVEVVEEVLEEEEGV